MTRGLADVPDGFFRPALAGVVPYEPGKPIEEVQRELGLDCVIKLASNEGPWGPLPQARAALAAATDELNRYPDGGGWALRTALAARFGLDFDEVVLGSGADGIIGMMTAAAIDPGDEVVCGWPSFPSYVIDARVRGAVPVTVPLRDHRYDLEAMVAAVTPRTKLVYVCYPNNPTGTINARDELDAYFDAVPEHVLTVLDQAYFEYVDDPEHVDGVERYLKQGKRIVVLRTFSKIYGLAGLRVGYALAPAGVVRALVKVKRAFDVTLTGQAAALASLDPAAAPELERRRRVTAECRARLARTLVENGLEPVPGVANFLYADVDGDAGALYGALLAEGVIVRPMGAFGAPGAVRVTVGTPEEMDLLAGALARVRGRTPAGAP